VTIRGKGLGGRNQEFVLAASLEMEGFQDVVVFSAGTDGTDGPTDAAGAIADGQTVDRARQLGLDPLGYLNRNDSYRFFEPLGDLIKTGPTHTNVMDLHILLIGGMGLTE
jgi:hydroxypyruvate reductase